MTRLLVALIIVLPIAAQIEATITGSVRDATGAGLPIASVLVRNVETGASHTLVTDAEGRYSAPALVIGRYELTASRAGFSPEIKTGIAPVVGQQLGVDFTLQIGELKQAV